MRVYDHTLSGAATAQTGNAQEVQRTDRGGSAGRTSGAAGGDRIEFSSAIGALSRAVAADKSDRAARVQELAAQYARGDYGGDSSATSRAMVIESLAASAR